jgi:hypothetical protein
MVHPAQQRPGKLNNSGHGKLISLGIPFQHCTTADLPKFATRQGKLSGMEKQGLHHVAILQIQVGFVCCVLLVTAAS